MHMYVAFSNYMNKKGISQPSKTSYNFTLIGRQTKTHIYVTYQMMLQRKPLIALRALMRPLICM